MMVIGLTGGIGSGKTTVANFFAELGIPVFIADDEGKMLMNSSQEIRELLTDLFGEEAYQEGELNRKFIAGKVFSDKKKLEALNAIIHPRVALHFERWKAKQEAPYVIYEAAILFEKGGYRKCDFNILVTAPHEEKIRRLQKRDRSTVPEIEARMNNQWPDEKKKELSDFLIENRELPATRNQVGEIHRYLLKHR